VITMAAQSKADGSRYWVSGFPELVAEWDFERNGVLTPEDVTAGSARMIWWRCPYGDDHRWRAKPNNRSAGTGCPFCANVRVSSTNNLAYCFPAIAAEWHPTKNGSVTPVAIVASSTRRCWWQCAHGHEWRTTVRERARSQTQCPYCIGKLATAGSSLATMHPALAREWHPTLNGALTPADVTLGSQRRVYWQCERDARHVWRTSIANRALRASGCPHCAR